MKSSAVYSASPSSLEIAVRRASPYFFWISSSSTRDDVPAAPLVLEQRVDLPHAPALLLQLLADDQDLEPRQAVDLQLEDRVGLLGVEVEALDDLLRRVRLALRLPDDLQDLVERVEDLLEALEDVDALPERLELVLQPPGHDLQPEVQEVPEHRVQIQPLGPADLGVLRSGIRHVRLTMKLVCSGVCLKRYAITIFSSASFFNSSAMRTSSVDRSLTSTSGGSLRLSATSAIRSTSVDLLTV